MIDIHASAVPVLLAYTLYNRQLVYNPARFIKRVSVVQHHWAQKCLPWQELDRQPIVWDDHFPQRLMATQLCPNASKASFVQMRTPCVDGAPMLEV